MDLQLSFDRGAAVPFHRQIYDALRSAIVAGTLRPGDRLPATRALAEELHISRLPVLTAYEQLLLEGYLEGRVGSGTFVAPAVPDALVRPAELRPEELDGPPPSTLPDRWKILGPFREGLPAVDHFPHRLWGKLLRRHTRQLGGELMAYGEAVGHGPLREAIAAHLRATRGVRCDARQVLIVSGSQMALHLAALVLLGPGDVACIEEPGYWGARYALAAAGRPVVPIRSARPVSTSSGSRASVTGRASSSSPPAHHYPLGAAMPATTRSALLDWAERNGAWIVEDDYDGLYRFAGPPLPALQGSDRADRVVYVGTFSKTLFPSLRIGYVVVPAALVSRFSRVRLTLDLCPPTLFQLVLTDFLAEGHFARHVRRMRTLYRARRDALVEGLQRHAEGLLTVAGADAGMHLVGFLPAASDDRKVARRAAERGVSVNPLSSCYIGACWRTGLILGFAAAPETQTDTAVRALADAIRSVVRGPG